MSYHFIERKDPHVEVLFQGLENLERMLSDMEKTPKPMFKGERFLTDEELADLQASFPTVWGQYIEKLSEYMASTGKRYQSHAATIRRWAGEDARKAAPPSRNRDYSVKEDETV